MSISENDDQPSTSGYPGYPAEDDEIGDLPASVQRRRFKWLNDSLRFSMIRTWKALPGVFFSSGVEDDCQSVWCSEWAEETPCGWLWEDLLG